MSKILCKYCGEAVEIPSDVSSVHCPVCGKLVENSEVAGNIQADKLLERTKILLQDGDWERAVQCSNLLLDDMPRNAYGYLYHYMATHQFRDARTLWCDASIEEPLSKERELTRALAFANEDLRTSLVRQFAAQEKFISFCKIRSSGKAYEDYALLDLRRNLKAFVEKDDMAMAEDYLQKRLDEEKNSSLKLVEQARSLAMQGLEREPEFMAAMHRVMELVKAKFQPAIDFVEKELPQLREQQSEIQFSTVVSTAPKGTEDYPVFVSSLVQLHKNLTALIEQGNGKAQEYLLHEYLELCYTRACAEQQDLQYENAITLFRCCGEYQDSASRLEECQKILAKQRFLKQAKRHLIWISSVAAIGLLVLACFYKTLHEHFRVRKALAEVKQAIQNNQLDLAATKLEEAKTVVGEDEPYWKRMHAELVDKHFQAVKTAIQRKQFEEAEQNLAKVVTIVGEEDSRVKAMRQSIQAAGQEKWIEEMLEYARQVDSKRDYTMFATTVAGLRKVLEYDPANSKAKDLLKVFHTIDPYPDLFLYLVDNNDKVYWESSWVTQKLWSKVMDENLRAQAKKAYGFYRAPNGQLVPRNMTRTDLLAIVDGKEGPDKPILWVTMGEAAEFCRRITSNALADRKIPQGYQLNYRTADFGGANERLPNGFRIALMPIK